MKTTARSTGPVEPTNAKNTKSRPRAAAGTKPAAEPPATAASGTKPLTTAKGSRSRREVSPPPSLTANELQTVDRYIELQRAVATAAAEIEQMEPGILELLRPRQIIERAGGRLAYSHEYFYTYSHAMDILSRSLAELKEYERNTCAAKVRMEPRVDFIEMSA